MLDIINELRFKEKTCKIFPYIQHYHDLLDSWMEKNDITEEILKRYILISFWMEYRAGNHRGDGITIKPISADEYLKNKRKIHDLAGKMEKKYTDKVTNYNPKKEIKLDENYFECEKRRKYYFKYFTKPINSTKEYLELTGFPPHGINPGEYLYTFVISGEKNIRV